MELKKVNLKDIAPYKNNPRKNDEAVDAVMESIRQCEYVAPIIVDENMEILAGHTRYKALLKLGKTEENVIIKEGLTEEQKRKYRYYDNRTNELAQWDEIGDLDLGDLSYLWEPQEENEYDFSEFESENERLKGTETVPISIRVPEKYKDDVMEYLSNGESKTAVGLGKGVLRRCGLL